ncbi:MAG: hypothetical protein GY737_30465 [Desulfobacteraceae bacterium]|nr:hypothetical protein [Desulfobacteraceae bacterium]
MLVKSMVVLLVLVWMVTPATSLANAPHNDTRDDSVEQVVMYHLESEAIPRSIQYLSWTPVRRLDNGHYKVTVRFRVKNRYKRSVLKKQIVIMDEGGAILKVMDCR